MKTWALIFIALLGVPLVMGCDDNQLKAMKDAAKKENLVDLEKRLNECLPVGTSYEEVDLVLKNLGWEYHYNRVHSAFLASKKLKFRLFISSSALITIHLDDKQRVSGIKLSELNTSWFG